LTESQITELKAQFTALYERWLSGEDARVQAELEGMDADNLRLLADANNLNVTSKTPKPKCVLLIGARFREKKQLTAGLATQVGRE
jgi:HSP20 family molecular chaperone IbpA